MNKVKLVGVNCQGVISIWAEVDDGQDVFLTRFEKYHEQSYIDTVLFNLNYFLSIGKLYDAKKWIDKADEQYKCPNGCIAYSKLYKLVYGE